MKAAVVTRYGPPEVLEIREVPAPVQGDLEFLKTLIERGELRAVVGRTFALDRIVEAHRHADTGHKVGNLVVVIGS